MSRERADRDGHLRRALFGGLLLVTLGGVSPASPPEVVRLTLDRGASTELRWAAVSGTTYEVLKAADPAFTESVRYVATGLSTAEAVDATDARLTTPTYYLVRARDLDGAAGTWGMGSSGAERLDGVTQASLPSGGELAEPLTTLAIHRHATDTGAAEVEIQSSVESGGWTHVRPYTVGGNNYVLLVKGQMGGGRAHRLNADGTLGPVVGSYGFPKDLTSVEIIVRDGQNPRLLLHKRIVGRVIVRRIGSDGQIGSQVSSVAHDDFKYRDIVRPYQTADGSLFVFSLSRWYGVASIHPLQASGALTAGQPPTFAGDGWTKGWSSAEVYNYGGQTFLVIYKLMDDPAGGGGGKIRVKQLYSDGTLQAGSHQVPGDGTWTQGYTAFRVIQRKGLAEQGASAGTGAAVAPQAAEATAMVTSAGSEPEAPGSPFVPADVNLLLVYKIHTGAYKVLELGASGIGAVVASGNLGAGWTDLASFFAGGDLYVIKLNEEGRIPFDHTMVRAFQDSLEEAFAPNQVRGGGYQLGIAQSGRIVYLHAAGFARRSTGKRLRTTDRHGIGSVAKLFTTATVIQTIEQGDLDLNDRLVEHFFPLPAGPSPVDYPFLRMGEAVQTNAEDVRIGELLNHTGRWESSSSTRALWEGRKNDKCDASALLDDDWTPDPGFRCHRGYQNANTGLLGWMLFHRFGLEPEESTQNTAYVQKLRQRWMDDAHVGGVFCGGYDDVLHYRECDGGPGCVDGYEEFERDAPGTCLSGGLAASTEDLLQLLGVFRYGKVFGIEAHQLMYQTQARDLGGNKAPYHWGHTLLEDEGWMRAKSGGGAGVSAYVAHLPRGVSVALITNTKPWKGEDGGQDNSPNAGDAVKAAWTAATGIAIADAQDD